MTLSERPGDHAQHGLLLQRFPDLSLEERRKLNYDHPNAFDFDLLYKHLQMLIQGESIKVPEYSFELYGRTGNYEIVVPRPVIIVEGILLFYDERIRNCSI